MRAPQSNSKVVRPKKKKVPSSPPAPTREDHREDELSPSHKVRSKLKQINGRERSPKVSLAASSLVRIVELEL